MKTIELDDVKIARAQLIIGLGAISIIYPNNCRFRHDCNKVKSKCTQRNKTYFELDDIRIIIEPQDRRITFITEDNTKAIYIFLIAAILEREITLVPLKK
jgi:hypothetical protein